jgi:peptide deformylase
MKGYINMIRDIVTDPIFLSQKSVPAVKSDAKIVTDLLDTLKANSDRCVGMAANMIGEKKQILAAADGDSYIVMINPQIADRSKRKFTAEEGCLSLSGTRTVERFESITVEYLDKKFKRRKKYFSGFLAQIIQHEIDHFDGILI